MPMEKRGLQGYNLLEHNKFTELT